MSRPTSPSRPGPHGRPAAGTDRARRGGAHEIRQRFHLPVVYLTASSNEEILERAKLTEPHGYLLKPYEDRELHVVLEMALYKHRTERKLLERERWLTATLASIGDGVVATDAEGRVAFLNGVAERPHRVGPGGSRRPAAGGDLHPSP